MVYVALRFVHLHNFVRTPLFAELTGRDAKFAELRAADRPEHEDLYDLQASVRACVDLLSWTNVSDLHPMAVANIHGLSVQFFQPEKVTSSLDFIWTPGTAFVDIDKRIWEPKFGGGYAWQEDLMSSVAVGRLQSEGVYPHAVELPPFAGLPGAHTSLREEARKHARAVNESVYIDEFGAMHVRLPPGRRVGCVTVSLGDTFFDCAVAVAAQFNNNGHVGRLGWAKLWARLANRSGTAGMALPAPGANLDPATTRDPYTYFMINVNVPPQGAMSGGPTESNHVTVDGDEVVLESRLHSSWLMGVQVQFV
eukprot:TRINITY_DN4055_c0_g1_i2.p1 TRINITY_DN4055_c0_g1~~TRINITY_DN4055_c0_g1_i2.p1  ORF type:complete len:309 (+),score=55.51 TRINITY_DN4055_c0_g1_i2:133-1059(+)